MNDEKAMRERALKLLARWAAAAEPYWWNDPDDRRLGCYGSGYLTWGVQSNWNYAGALATLAAWGPPGERDRWRDRALAALRFALATHLTGHRAGTDGQPWGGSWISVLGIERAMHGLMHLTPELMPGDAQALRRVLTSEADWLLLHAVRGKVAGVAAGLWNRDGRNFPESNAWSGCLLWRVAALYPEEPHAAAWRDRAHSYLMNAVSLEADARDPRVVEGRPVSEWHVGANFFPSYALDHHGYLNVGYMAICVSQAAILHFDLKRAGLAAPASLYHHQAGLWGVLRRLIFGDGRLARIGGDSRVRYAYCQEYLMPTLLFAADHLRDPQALELAARQLELIERDAAGGDGLFYDARLEWLRRENPHYHNRLESDRACVLAHLVNNLPLVNEPPGSDRTFEESVAGGWVEEAHGAAMHRSAGRLASFSWRAHGLTQALCLPPDDGSLAEWSGNLCPVVRFLGEDQSYPGRHRRLLAHHIRSFDGGFVTCGSVMEGVAVAVDEGASCTDQAMTHIAFAALPDGRTCLCLQHVRAAADRLVYLAELKGLHLVVPNDRFNGNRRVVGSASGSIELLSPPERDGVVEVAGDWVNIDERLGVRILQGPPGTIGVERSVQRRAGKYRSLFTEEFCLGARTAVTRCRPGELLLDLGFAVLSNVTATDTAAVEGGSLALGNPDLRGVWVAGGDGKRYALVANFGCEARTATLWGEAIAIESGQAALIGPARDGRENDRPGGHERDRLSAPTESGT